MISKYAILLFILSCLWMGVQGQPDTIKPGEALVFSNPLTSADGRFKLGFFRPGTTNSDYSYLGIWYHQDDATKVWVTNRTTPLYGFNINLTMDGDGFLKIMQSGTEISSIVLNPNQAAKSSSATLQNNGNFVVTELNPDGSNKQVLWESFDYPTDTLLPGMKLGMNLTTGKSWSLTSWLTGEIAGPGAFSLDWIDDFSGTGTGQLIGRRRGEVYWTSGRLDITSRSFENIPWLSYPDTDGNNYNFSFVSDDSASYFNYSVLDGAISWWKLHPEGVLYDGIKPALVPNGVCYGYPGCQVQTPTCRSENDPFVQRAGSFSGSPFPYDDNFSIGLSDCWAKCWNECSCIGYFTRSNNGTGCFMWRNDSIFSRSDNENSLTWYVLNSTLLIDDNGSKNGNNWWKWVLIAVVPVLVALLLVLGIFYYLCRKKQREDRERIEKEDEQIFLELTASNNENEFGNYGEKGHDLKVFTFASIMAATNDFSSENKLGQGGFGPVYKGKLPEGQEIAVKRLSRSSGQGLLEFKNELILIAKVQHMNLVRLLGCCVRQDEKMLIYEFMPNKSLDFFLFDPSKRELLDWKKCYHIIDGIAQGLLYLHKYSRVRIIHRDMKASNILLDDDMNPKISDFGMARIFGQNESVANTNRVVGTYGYMAPEYAMEGNFSDKSDVYSFGVLLLEVVSGRKNNSFYHYDRPMNLVGYAWELWREGSSLDLMDSTLADSYSRSQILRCIHVGLLCVQEHAVDRPTMSDVISMLTNENLPLPTPKQIAFSTQQKLREASLPRNEEECCSIIRASITEMEAR